MNSLSYSFEIQKFKISFTGIKSRYQRAVFLLEILRENLFLGPLQLPETHLHSLACSTFLCFLSQQCNILTSLSDLCFALMLFASPL